VSINDSFLLNDMLNDILCFSQYMTCTHLLKSLKKTYKQKYLTQYVYRSYQSIACENAANNVQEHEEIDYKAVCFQL
jgi:hypothetical protein